MDMWLPKLTPISMCIEIARYDFFMPTFPLTFAPFLILHPYNFRLCDSKCAVYLLVCGIFLEPLNFCAFTMHKLASFNCE